MAATEHAQAVKKDTKEFITTALMQLLAKHRLSALTVSQVCERAGVSRMAFYRNFDDLEQILYAYYQPKYAAIFDMLRQNPDDSVKLEQQLEFFDAYGDDLVVSVDRGFEPILMRIFTEEMAKFYGADSDDYWTAFMSAGVYAIWRKWLIEGRQKPLEEIIGFLRTLDTLRVYRSS